MAETNVSFVNDWIIFCHQLKGILQTGAIEEIFIWLIPFALYYNVAGSKYIYITDSSDGRKIGFKMILIRRASAANGHHSFGKRK